MAKKKPQDESSIIRELRERVEELEEELEESQDEAGKLERQVGELKHDAEKAKDRGLQIRYFLDRVLERCDSTETASVARAIREVLDGADDLDLVFARVEFLS